MRLLNALLLCCAASIASAAAPDLAALERTMRKGKPRIAGVLTGHEGPVRRVALSQDGTRIVSAGDDKTVRVWNARSGELIHTLPETERGASFLGSRHGTAAARSPDSSMLARPAGGGLLETHPLTGDGKTVYLAGHKAPITSIVFGPKGDRLATGSEDGTVRVWTLGRPDPIEFWKLDQPWREALANAMQERTSFDFDKAPFVDVLSFFSANIDVPVVLDPQALDDPPPVTLRMGDVTYADGLKRVLRPLGLRSMPYDGALLVTTPERQNELLREEAWAAPVMMPWETREISFDFLDTPIPEVISFFCVATDRMVLTSLRGDRAAVTLRAEDMPEDRFLRWVSLLTGCAHLWADDGILVARPERLEHLDRIRRAVSPLAGVPNADLAEKLAQPVSFRFAHKRIGDVAAWLANDTGLPIVVEDALKRGRIPTLNLRVHNRSLRDVLVWICTMSELNCAWRNGKLVIYRPARKGRL